LFKPTLDRFPVPGVGVAGPSPNTLEAVLAFRGLVELNDDLLPPPTTLCSNGLTAEGEYCGTLSFEGEVPNLGDEYCCPEPGLAMLERGELA